MSQLHQDIQWYIAEIGEKWIEIKFKDIQLILASLEKLKIVKKVPDGKPTHDSDPYGAPWELA